MGIVDLCSVHNVPAVRAELLGDNDKKSPQSVRLSPGDGHLHRHLHTLAWEVGGWEKKSLDENLLYLKVSAGEALAKTGPFFGKRGIALCEFNLDAFNFFTRGAHP